MNKVKYLLTYRYAMIIHDLTVDFTRIYILGHLSGLRNLSQDKSINSRPDYRTADQMNQAARSGKQNIVESVGQSRTSSKGEIKLLGVANASFEELLTDYEDFLRQNNLKIYDRSDKQIDMMRKIAFRLSHLSNLSRLGDFKEKPKLCYKPEIDANFLLTLCHQVTYLLSKQIQAMENKFISEGGYNEKIFNKRMKHRRQKND